MTIVGTGAPRLYSSLNQGRLVYPSKISRERLQPAGQPSSTRGTLGDGEGVGRKPIILSLPLEGRHESRKPLLLPLLLLPPHKVKEHEIQNPANVHCCSLICEGGGGCCPRWRDNLSGTSSHLPSTCKPPFAFPGAMKPRLKPPSPRPARFDPAVIPADHLHLSRCTVLSTWGGATYVVAGMTP